MEDDSLDVVRFWERLGLPGIIDVHTHFMPEQVLRKVWAYFDSAGPLTGLEWPITYRYEEEQRLSVLRSFGVLRFTSMLYPHKPGMARWLNGWAAGFAARTPDCLHTATLFPEDGVELYVKEAVESGARVFKSHLQVGGYDANDPLLEGAWGLLAEARVPVVMHCGSGPAPGRFTGPEPIGRLLARHPQLRLIVAHMGMPEYAEFLALAEAYPEVRLDTTMAFTDFSERLSPVSGRPAGAARRSRGPDPARDGLPEHSVPVRPPAGGPGAAGARGGVAAGRLLPERGGVVREPRIETDRFLRQFTETGQASLTGGSQAGAHDDDDRAPGAYRTAQAGPYARARPGRGRRGSARRAALDGPAVRGVGGAQRR